MTTMIRPPMSKKRMMRSLAMIIGYISIILISVVSTSDVSDHKTSSGTTSSSDGSSSMMMMTMMISFLIICLTSGVIYLFYPALSIRHDDLKISTETIQSSKNDENEEQNNNVLLSIIIPAYNEEERIPIMLDAALKVMNGPIGKEIVALAQEKHLEQIAKDTTLKEKQQTPNQIEWIIVNDGSKDDTIKVVKNHVQNNNNNNDQYTWKFVTLHTNSGKGCAVKHGMLQSKGIWKLMVDADGATEFSELKSLFQHASSYPIVFGSRAHLQESSKAKRSFLRTLLMHAFHFFLDILLLSSPFITTTTNSNSKKTKFQQTAIADTQCGFKLFHISAARPLFYNLHLKRWAFDIELVVLARALELGIAEVCVEWREVDGSKLDSSKFQLALVSLGMLRDMMCVRLCFSLGIWKIQL